MKKRTLKVLRPNCDVLHELANPSLTDALKICFSRGGFVAGGFARRLLTHFADDASIVDWTAFRNDMKRYVEFADVDVFVDDVHSLSEHLSVIRAGKPTVVSERIVNVWVGDLQFSPHPERSQTIFQLITTSDSIESVIESFDIFNAAVAFDGKNFYYFDGWQELEASGTLLVQNWVSPASTIFRLGKWMTRHGYIKLALETQREIGDKVFQVLEENCPSNCVALLDVSSAFRDKTNSNIIKKEFFFEEVKKLLPLLTDGQLVQLASVIKSERQAAYGSAAKDPLTLLLERHSW